MFTIGTALLAFLSVAVIIDILKHQIPNWLTGGGMILAISWTLVDPAYSVSLTSALAGTGLGVALLFPIFLLGKVGAGDVKLLGMAGAYLGPVPIFWGGMFSLIAGGVLALAWMLMLKLAPLQARRMVPNASSTLLFLAVTHGGSEKTMARGDLTADPRRFPYACAIAVGCSLAYLGFF